MSDRQTDIFGGSAPVETSTAAPVVAAVQERLFGAPQTLRGQLAMSSEWLAAERAAQRNEYDRKRIG